MDLIPEKQNVTDNLDFCVREEYLTPFMILVPGFIIQVIKAFIIMTISVGYTTGDLRPKKDKNPSEFKIVISWIFIVYELLGIGGSVYFDIRDGMDSWIPGDYWLNYQCVSRILVDSGNAQTMLAFLAVYLTTFGVDWLLLKCCCCCFKSNEEPEKKENEMSSCQVLCALECKDKIIVYMNIFVAIIYIGAIFTHFMTGMFVFFPLILVSGIIGIVFGMLFVPITFIIFIWSETKSTATINAVADSLQQNIELAYRNKIVDTHQVTHSELELKVRERGATTVMEIMGVELNKDVIEISYCKLCCGVCQSPSDCCNVCVASLAISIIAGCLIFIFGSLLIAAQCMIPLYAGNGYMQSFWYTITHRKFRVYMANYRNDVETMWRFAVALL